MIGQKRLLNLIENQIEMEEFPRFSIIVGAKGSGKKTLCMSIAYALNSRISFIEPKIDSVREMIKSAYESIETMIYVIPNSDTMSLPAKNALLKVCEETPNNAYIIMLATNDSLILDTLKSRASIYRLEPYTKEEISSYINTNKNILAECADVYVELCETPGDVNELYKQGALELYEYVEKTVDNIAFVSPANALKIANSISFKESEEGKFSVEFFLRAFKAVCGTKLKECVALDDVEGQMWYSAGIKVASNTLNQLSITGINKGALFDMFILDIRKEWCDAS